MTASLSATALPSKADAFPVSGQLTAHHGTTLPTLVVGVRATAPVNYGDLTNPATIAPSGFATALFQLAAGTWSLSITALAAARAADAVGALIWLAFITGTGPTDPLIAVAGPFTLAA